MRRVWAVRLRESHSRVGPDGSSRGLIVCQNCPDSNFERDSSRNDVGQLLLGVCSLVVGESQLQASWNSPGGLLPCTVVARTLVAVAGLMMRVPLSPADGYTTYVWRAECCLRPRRACAEGPLTVRP